MDFYAVAAPRFPCAQRQGSLWRLCRNWMHHDTTLQVSNFKPGNKKLHWKQHYFDWPADPIHPIHPTAKQAKQAKLLPDLAMKRLGHLETRLMLRSRHLQLRLRCQSLPRRSWSRRNCFLAPQKAVDGGRKWLGNFNISIHYGIFQPTMVKYTHYGIVYSYIWCYFWYTFNSLQWNIIPLWWSKWNRRFSKQPQNASDYSLKFTLVPNRGWFNWLYFHQKISIGVHPDSLW